MKRPDEMTREDYARLGLKSGLEVHQQLDTRHKLFCRCPATRYSPRYDAEILRHMRPTLSELGVYDPTALMEFKTRKEVIYRIARDTVCTYEMDDAPPFELNREALDIALEIAMMFSCSIVGELHIARKQYLDGSIPTGFQRTTILGVHGAMPVRFSDGEIHRIGIRQLALEEDSCREVSDRRHTRTYMTDRLSIPLIEAVTEAQMHTPQDVALVAEAIRRQTRATGKVRTGGGAGREDVNVSVAGGDRVEIKGVPSIRAIPALVHYEALRQRALLDIRADLLKRDLDPEAFPFVTAEVTNYLRHTMHPQIRAALAEGAMVLAVRLPRFQGVLKRRTAPSNRFDHELSGRVRVIACLDTLPNLCSTDGDLQGITPRNWERIGRAVSAESGDAVVLVWGPEQDARTAAEEIWERARIALVGVPQETRRARRDGSTDFERVLPGPDRMYPDTDLPPIALSDEHLDRVRGQMARPHWESEADWRAAGLNEQLITDVARSGRQQLFERLRARNGVDPTLVAVVIGQQIKATNRRWATHLDDERMEALFARFAEGRFAREAFPELLAKLGHDAALPVDEAIEAFVPTPPPADPEAWRAQAREALEAAPAWREVADPRARRKEAMGVVMGAGLRGWIPGRDVAAWLGEAVLVPSAG